MSDGKRKPIEKPCTSAKETHCRIFKPGDFCKGGRYKIFDLLGAGGMCEVWRAFDQEAPNYEQQWVAVKVLKSKLAFDDESKRRLEKEAETLLDVDHKNLVNVFHADVDEERNIFFYVMELLEGETLDAKIKRTGGLLLADALRIVAEVADAVHGIHRLGIIHRDLKPENIYVTKDGRTVVLDLGVAKFDPKRFPNRATQPTGPNTILGTLAYMSPEQVLGSQQLDARSDVYALGLIAYACIAGFHPAQGSPGGWMPQDLAQWGGWHVNNAPKPLPLVMPWLHARVWKAVSKALTKEAGRRYGSAAEFSAELHGLAVWLKTHDLLRPPASPPKADVDASLPLATTERETVMAASAPGLRITRGGSRSMVILPPRTEDAPSAPASPRPSRASKPEVAPRSRESQPESTSAQATPNPRTASGTEIIRLAPSSQPATPSPRTASGTEIITVGPASRALAPLKEATRQEGATASSTGNRSDAAAAESTKEKARRPAASSNPRASQSTPTAHAVPVVSAKGSGTRPRRLVAFGGAGVVLGMCVAALVVGLVGLSRRSSAPALASASTAMSAPPPAPQAATEAPALAAPLGSESPQVLGSAIASATASMGPNSPPLSRIRGPIAPTPRKPIQGAPTPQPKTDRIAD